MHPRRHARLAAIIAAGAILITACSDDPLAPRPVDDPSSGVALAAPVTANHVGCPASLKFTGGGRVDADSTQGTMGGKITFGFNVFGGADCGPAKGQLQVDHHPSQTKFHSLTIEHFASWTEADGAVCGEFSGVLRAKHGNGAWHEHDYEVQFCDRGEPGSSPGTGPDTWRFQIYGDETFGHGSMAWTELTGGNIQAH